VTRISRGPAAFRFPKAGSLDDPASGLADVLTASRRAWQAAPVGV